MRTLIIRQHGPIKLSTLIANLAQQLAQHGELIVITQYHTTDNESTASTTELAAQDGPIPWSQPESDPGSQEWRNNLLGIISEHDFEDQACAWILESQEDTRARQTA